jgi:hypothetical protein
MKSKWPYILPIVTACLGVTIGSVVSNWKHDDRAQQARRKNYTDRARVCIEAAALLRGGQPKVALKFLESRALGAIRGVPMGRSYDELSSDSQSLLVSAKRYQESFADVDLEVDELTRGDVPDDHPRLSTTLRVVTSNLDG